MSDWSIEKEFYKLTNESSLSSALFKAGMIKSINSVFQLEETDNWERGGAETYIYNFNILESGIKTAYIMKACVTMDMRSDIGIVLGKWVQRRILLERNGVKTPKLYIHGNGILVEEFIPYKFVEIISKKSFPNINLSELARIYGIIAKLGFQPISLLNDFRSHGDDVILVDFGQDLGEPEIKKHSQDYENDVYKLFLREIKLQNIELPDQYKESLYIDFFLSTI